MMTRTNFSGSSVAGFRSQEPGHPHMDNQKLAVIQFKNQVLAPAAEVNDLSAG